MVEFDWKKQNPQLAQQLAELEQPPLPSRLSSEKLFEILDGMEAAGEAFEKKKLSFPWQSVLSCTAVFLLIILIYSWIQLGWRLFLKTPFESSTAVEVASQEMYREGQLETTSSMTMIESADGNLESDAFSRGGPDSTVEIPQDVASGTHRSTEMQISPTTVMENFIQAEMVVSGTVAQVADSWSEGDSFLSWKEITLTQTTYLKGEAQEKELVFRVIEEKIPMAESAINEQHEVSISVNSKLEVGKQILVMFTQTKEGKWQVLPKLGSILEVKNQVVIGPAGEEYGTWDAFHFTEEILKE